MVRKAFKPERITNKLRGVEGLSSADAYLAAFSQILGGTSFSTLQIPGSFLALSLVYFILGYLLFAVLMAGAGSIATTAREGQQLSTMFTMLAVIPFLLAPFIMGNPNHAISQVLTLFPFTTPITVMIRLAFADIPAWQLVLSIGLMIAAIIGSLWLAAKVFRTFLLMYGKGPTLGEIIRCLREA
jgi:ABC-2 type transport system permease protein